MWAFEDIHHPWQSVPRTQCPTNLREMDRDKKDLVKTKLRKGPSHSPTLPEEGGGAEDGVCFT